MNIYQTSLYDCLAQPKRCHRKLKLAEPYQDEAKVTTLQPEKALTPLLVPKMLGVVLVLSHMGST